MRVPRRWTACALLLVALAACGRIPQAAAPAASPSPVSTPTRTPVTPTPLTSASTPASPAPSRSPAGPDSPSVPSLAAPSGPVSSAPGTVPPPSEDDQAPAGTQCEYVATGTAARPVTAPTGTDVPASGELTAVVAMTGGTVRIALDPLAAPCTVNSFVALVRQGFYTKTRCHRLVDSRIFILQCGDPTGSGTGGPGYTFADELDGTEQYTGGVVAMANGGPNTNGSQFFFVYQDSATLEPKYTVFGRIDAASQRVIGTMAEEGQDGKNPQGGGRPNNPSEIVSITLQY